MSKFHVVADGPPAPNTYLDTFQSFKALIGLGVSANAAQINAQNSEPFIGIHMNLVPPLDADMLDDSLVIYMEAVGLNFRVKAKYKDTLGNTFTGNLGLLSP